MEHSFAICAYKDSPYLEACIESLLNQSVKSKIFIVSSTPSDYIKNLAEKYNLSLFINIEKKGIGADWNFAYNKASTRLVTIAHQDDIYHKDYTKYLLKLKNKYPDMSLFTTSSKTIRENILIEDTYIEKIKALLRTPLLLWEYSNKSVLKKISISFGNPIICPSCTYDRFLCGANIFSEKLNFVLDWECLYRLAKDTNRWIYINKALIQYRVHKESATKLCQENNKRIIEESFMFEKIWGKAITKFILFFYTKAHKAYK